jgi:hypothetical protein
LIRIYVYKEQDNLYEIREDVEFFSYNNVQYSENICSASPSKNLSVAESRTKQKYTGSAIYGMYSRLLVRNSLDIDLAGYLANLKAGY